MDFNHAAARHLYRQQRRAPAAADIAIQPWLCVDQFIQLSQGTGRRFLLFTTACERRQSHLTTRFVTNFPQPYRIAAGAAKLRRLTDTAICLPQAQDALGASRMVAISHVLYDQLQSRLTARLILVTL